MVDSTTWVVSEIVTLLARLGSCRHRLVHDWPVFRGVSGRPRAEDRLAARRILASARRRGSAAQRRHRMGGRRTVELAAQAGAVAAHRLGL
eukprot:scaffold38168_cov66-Phaeocystis_antarctica.AAC.1